MSEQPQKALQALFLANLQQQAMNSGQQQGGNTVGQPPQLNQAQFAQLFSLARQAGMPPAGQSGHGLPQALNNGVGASQNGLLHNSPPGAQPAPQPALQLPASFNMLANLQQALSPGAARTGAPAAAPPPALAPLQSPTAAGKPSTEQGGLASVLGTLLRASQTDAPLLPPSSQHHTPQVPAAALQHVLSQQQKPHSFGIAHSQLSPTAGGFPQQPQVLREQHPVLQSQSQQHHEQQGTQGLLVSQPHPLSNQHVAGVAAGAGMVNMQPAALKPINPVAQVAAVEKEAMQHKKMQQEQMMMLLQQRQQQVEQAQLKQQEMRRALLGQTLGVQSPAVQPQQQQGAAPQEHHRPGDIIPAAAATQGMQLAPAPLGPMHPVSQHPLVPLSMLQPGDAQLHRVVVPSGPSGGPAAAGSPPKITANGSTVTNRISDALAAHLKPTSNPAMVQYMQATRTGQQGVGDMPPQLQMIPMQPHLDSQAVQGVLAPPPPAINKPKQPPKPPANKNPRLWLVQERDSLRRVLSLFGVGRWSTLHTALIGLHKTCEKTEQEVQDACWHFIQALEEFVMVPEDKTFLQQLLTPVADRGKIVTPGAAWNKLNGTTVKRLRLLEEIRNAMSLLQQPAVYGTWLAAVTALSDQGQPASWWDVKCDLGLLYGCWKHGYANYDEMRKDPEYAHIFTNPAGGSGTDPAAEAAAGGGGASEGGAGGEGEGGEGGKSGGSATTPGGAPTAENLTKRFRRLLDMVFRAQKTSAAAAEKAAKEAEKAAKEAARAAREAEEKAAREAVLRKHQEEKAARAAQRKKAAAEQGDLKEQARRLAAEVQDAAGGGGDEGVGHTSRGRRTKRALDEDEYMVGNELEDELRSPAGGSKQKKVKTHVPRPSKNPDDLSAKQVSDLLKLLMAWGVPTHLDWATLAQDTPPLTIPTPKPITGSKAGAGKDAAAAAAAAGAGDGQAGGEEGEGGAGGEQDGQPSTGGAAQGGADGGVDDQAEEHKPQLTAPVTDRAAAVANLITGLNAMLALPERVSDALVGHSITSAWSQVGSAEQMCGGIRELCPSLATRSDKALMNAVLDMMADMQDVEEGTTRKKPQHAAPANKTLKHAASCACAVCVRVRNAVAKRQAAQGAGGEGGEGGGKEGDEEEAGAGGGSDDGSGSDDDEHEDGGAAAAAGGAGAGPSSGQGATAAGGGAAETSTGGQGDEQGDEQSKAQQDQEEGGAGQSTAGAAPTPAKPAVPPTLRLLTAPAASKLRERVGLLMMLHAGVEALKPAWQEQPALMNRMGDLPVWWAPAHDGQLAAGVLKHGFGEWSKVFEDEANTFMSAQQDFLDRQHARRAAARAIKAGGTPAEGTEALTQDEVDTLASLPEDAPVMAAALPGQPALLKRCRQISTTMLRFLRKGKYLGEVVGRKRRKQAGGGDVEGGDGGGEAAGASKRSKAGGPGGDISAEAWAIAMDVMATAGAPGGTGDEAAKPAGKRRGRPPGTGKKQLAAKLQEEALKTQALKIALDVMVKTGRDGVSTGGESTHGGRTTSQAGEGGAVKEEEEEEDEEATEGTLSAGAAVGRGKVRKAAMSDAQSPGVKKKQGRGKAAAAAGGGAGEGEGDKPAKKPRAPRKPKVKAEDAGLSDLAMKIALEAAAAVGGGGGGGAGKVAMSKVGETSSLAQGTSAAAPTGGKTASLATGAGSNATHSAPGFAARGDAGGAAGEVTSPGAAAPPGKVRKRAAAAGVGRGGGADGGRGAGSRGGGGRGAASRGGGGRGAGRAAGGRAAGGRGRKKAVVSDADDDDDGGAPVTGAAARGGGPGGGPSSGSAPSHTSSAEEKAEDADEGIAGVFSGDAGQEEEDALLYMQLDTRDMGHGLLDDLDDF